MVTEKDITSAITGPVAAGELAGAAALVLRKGQGVRAAIVGRRDLDSGAPIERDSRGGVGTIGWPGAYGSWWQADPNDGSVLIFMAHSMADLPQMARGVGLGAWSAIGSFHSVATA